MKHTLLLVLGILAGAVPAQGQYIYLDVNGDGLNFDREAINNNFVPIDGLNSTVTSVDVYLVTDKVADGNAATCTSEEPFTIGSYEVVLRNIGHGVVYFQGWTDAMGFEVPIISGGDGTFATGGTDAWVGRGSSSPDLPPGTYKLGTVSVTITGYPVILFGMNSSLDGYAETAFGSQCDGALFDSTIRLGPLSEIGITADFTESFGSTDYIGVVSTTWGKIKERYR
jgi:hypothetical protein